MKQAISIFVEFLFPLSFAILLYWVAPLRMAVQFGGDEGYELMKGLLCSQGYLLYQEIWNDQPPLHTALLTALFKLFGPSAFGGRLLAVAFATLLVWAFYRLVSMRVGHLASFLALLLLISSPDFLQLSVSTMIELPAMALGLASTLAYFVYLQKHRCLWLAVSGVIMGCAIQTKLTAVIFIPALFIECLMSCDATQLPSKQDQKKAFPLANGELVHPRSEVFLTRLSALWGKSILGSMAIWIAIMLGTFGLIVLLYPGESFGVFFASHFSAETKIAIAAAGSGRYAFKNSLLLENYDTITTALVGGALVIWRKRRNCLFPLVLFVTVFLVHQLHSPYWYYYWLHFAIPLAWLAAIGVRELFLLIWESDWCEFRQVPFKPAWGMLVLSALLSLVIVRHYERIGRALASILNSESVSENPVVNQLVEYRNRTKWVFTDRPIYAFHARIGVPPELAVIPSKRFWSGQLTSAHIVEQLTRYQPEQILLLGTLKEERNLMDYVQDNYEKVSDQVVNGFYILRTQDRGQGSSSPFHSFSAQQQDGPTPSKR